MEPLIPLARAVAAEIDRLDLYPAAVHIDAARRVVVVEGVERSDPQERLIAAFGKARLRVETADRGVLIIHPS
jgi:hypothetical protein